eukprot:scaffold146268_cov13-Tisochrysis_lutea.AAC.1
MSATVAPAPKTPGLDCVPASLLLQVAHCRSPQPAPFCSVCTSICPADLLVLPICICRLLPSMQAASTCPNLLSPHLNPRRRPAHSAYLHVQVAALNAGHLSLPPEQQLQAAGQGASRSAISLDLYFGTLLPAFEELCQGPK